MDGVPIRYLMAGSGPPVILIHGLGNSAVSWQNNIGPLSETFSVYAIDLPGHGLSAGYDGRYDLSYAARFLGRFLDTLEHTKVNLVVSSMGGLVAMKTALDLSERVSSLALVSSAGLGRELAYFFRALTLPMAGELLSRPSRRKTKWGLKQIIYDHSLITDALIDEVYRLRSTPGASKTMLNILRYGADIRGQKEKVILLDQLQGLNIPTLIVWGTQDRIIPSLHAYVAHRRIKGSRLYIYEECGHWPQMEKSDSFNALVTGFLQESYQGARYD